MEFYDKKDKKIVSLLKSAKEVKPSEYVLSRVLQSLAVEDLKKARKEKAGLPNWFGARLAFASVLILMAIVGSVRLMTPSHVAVASEIAALELASDEISGAIDSASVLSGDVGMYELDFIESKK